MQHQTRTWTPPPNKLKAVELPDGTVAGGEEGKRKVQRTLGDGHGVDKKKVMETQGPTRLPGAREAPANGEMWLKSVLF